MVARFRKIKNHPRFLSRKWLIQWLPLLVAYNPDKNSSLNKQDGAVCTVILFKLPLPKYNRVYFLPGFHITSLLGWVFLLCRFSNDLKER
jgi:hypothetical protein